LRAERRVRGKSVAARLVPGVNGRFLVAAFGDAGHAFPAIALARALRDRGNEVVVETWEHWREAVEGEGLKFTAAEEYKTFPPPPPGSDGPSAADAAKALLPFVEEFAPDVVVSDILTMAPALAAEMAGRRRAVLVPHVYPVHEPGLPFFAFGAQPPRTAVGRGLWKAAEPVLVKGLERGRRELNATRAECGLAPLEELHGGLSAELVLVATLPQLEYPRRWPANTHVTGPMTFELERPDVEVPEGDLPLVVVAPSTAQDPERKLLRWALEGLADEPVRVLATTNQLDVPVPLPEAPANAVVVDWLSYSQALPLADLVLTHGGHGTVCRALGAGAPLLCCPAVGDMAENAARVQWAGAGRMIPWRLTGPRSIRTVVRQMLRDPSFREHASTLAAWASDNDGADAAAGKIEALA
jgi:UDP:flavonoid glycosyltransferase YjiC (YdhE family)